jgi:glycosyltransferase involved in cell wall biosynthesis
VIAPLESFDPEEFKRSWVSAAVLKSPELKSSGLIKGVLILNQVDHVLKLLPSIRSLFFIIERRGWHGMNTSRLADIKLIEDSSTAEHTKQLFPDAIGLDLGPADFVDHASFFPLNRTCEADVIQISCWSKRKRIELYIEAATLLPKVSFIHLGHFENGGTDQELKYRDECIAHATKAGCKMSFPFGDRSHNSELPVAKNEMNDWINKAKIGVLTTTSEGINRFKMECLAADRPVLVPDDVATPTKKHITAKTGCFYKPNPASLADAISATLANRMSFRPRDYILTYTGKDRSISRLKEALKTICCRTGQDFAYGDIDWDGRNQSLLWGEEAITLLTAVTERFSPRFSPAP